MALDTDECKEMLSRILSAIDYDIWKEVEAGDSELTYDELVAIVEEYVKINP